MGVMINSCEVAEQPESTDVKDSGIEVAVDNLLVVKSESEMPYFYDDFETVSLNGYIIEFSRLLQEKDADGNVLSTTFEYAITGTGETAQLDSFYLGVPQCASANLLSWTPSNSSKLEENRIKWNSSIPKNAIRELYTVTYAGNIPMGITEVFVVRGGIEKKTLILGPCGGYDVSGSVYIDTEGAGFGTFQDSETGVGEVEIQINSADYSSAKFTEEDGLYQFRVLPGTYSISVTNGKDLFNDGNYLNSNYAPKTVKVDQNVSGNDFGYLVDSDKVVNKFETGQILLNTLSTKSWMQELKTAGKGNFIYPKARLVDFLYTIQEDLLEEETFEFGLLEDKSNGDAAIAAALDLLSRPIKTEKDLFIQQLLTAELNVVSGRGALTQSGTLNVQFNLALLKYGEAKACQEFGICEPDSGFFKTSAVTVKAVSGTSSRLLSSFNDNGTGGL